MIIKVAALAIKNRKLLLVRSQNQNVFFTVGGKLEAGESEFECLIREIKEEINCQLQAATHFATFEGPAHQKDTTVRLICYLVALSGDPEPTSEIAELHWWDSNSQIKLSEMLQVYVIPALKNRLD